MGTFTAKNFEQFQRYKDREPTWIMLHRALLRDYEFAHLPDAAKGHLMMIWLLLSQEKDRTLPDDPKWIAAQIGANEPVDLALYYKHGWLIPSSVEHDTESYQVETETVPSRARAPSVSVLSGSDLSLSPDLIPPDPNRALETEPDPLSFDAFYASYPRRVGKEAAAKSWKRLTVAERELALADVSFRKAGVWFGKELEFIPHPASYLNQKRWTDDPSQLAVVARAGPAPLRLSPANAHLAQRIAEAKAEDEEIRDVRATPGAQGDLAGTGDGRRDAGGVGGSIHPGGSPFGKGGGERSCASRDGTAFGSAALSRGG